MSVKAWTPKSLQYIMENQHKVIYAQLLDTDTNLMSNKRKMTTHTQTQSHTYAHTHVDNPHTHTGKQR